MWKKLKSLVTDEDVEQVAQVPTPEVVSLTQIEESLSIDIGKSPVSRKEQCRTPMGSYVVPDGEKPLTALGHVLPGPADYLPKLNIIKRDAPHFSIVGRPKNPDDKRQAPGPSKYNTSGDIAWKKRKFPISGKGKDYLEEEADRNFGLAGKYRVEHLNCGKNGPKFKMGIRTGYNIFAGPADRLVQPVDTKGFETPGPIYRPNSSFWVRGTKKSLGPKLKEMSKDRIGPGPADYVVPTTNRGPSHTFGIKLPEPFGFYYSGNQLSPAANAYDIGTTIGKAPAVSITSRPSLTFAEQEGISGYEVPCPTTYNTVRRTYHKYKAVSLTYRWFDTEVPKTPGPADYNVKNINMKTYPSYTCRQRVKPTYPDSKGYRMYENIPGPCEYSPAREFDHIREPAYSFRRRVEPPKEDKDAFPGPNAYAPEKCDKPGFKKAPSFSIAGRLPTPKCIRGNPGPGEYFPKDNQTEKRGFTMTSRPKYKGKGTLVNPVAPNKYTLPELITGKNKGVALKSRASPYVYSGFRTTKLEEPRTVSALPVLVT